MKAITAAQAQLLMTQGVVMVDVRSASERAREHIAGSQHVPLETFESHGLPWLLSEGAIFYCRSGNRTQLNAPLIAASLCDRCPEDVLYVLEGGLNAWKRAGFTVEKHPSQPIELTRQVLIAAGSLVLLGVTLGALTHPGFYVLSGVVGVGMVFAGITGFCGMARLLMKAPWNRRRTKFSTQ